jgi:hypothetical protein
LEEVASAEGDLEEEVEDLGNFQNVLISHEFTE